MMKIQTLGLFACLILTMPGRAEHAVWDPARTWVFAVGVLQFDDRAVAGYPDKGRADAEMIGAMQKRGVPSDHIVFVKNSDATRDNLLRQLGPFLQRAGSRDTLFFYYGGHGDRDYSDPARTCTFLTYDTKSKWTVASIFDTVQEHFPGAQAIYTAHCCHSGSLTEEAARHQGKAGVLASAHACSKSSGNWTFTRCLTQMFEGDPVLDFDGNGEITFAEAARYIEEETAFAEGQHAAHAATGGFPADMVMARATGLHTAHAGDHVMGESHGQWWKAEVLTEKDGKFFVTWPGWARRYDEWLSPDRIRPFASTTWPVGTEVQAKWNGHWFDGKVIKTELGLHLIHYDGSPASDDEWIGMEYLRAKTPAKERE